MVHDAAEVEKVWGLTILRSPIGVYHWTRVECTDQVGIGKLLMIG